MQIASLINEQSKKSKAYVLEICNFVLILIHPYNRLRSVWTEDFNGYNAIYPHPLHMLNF